MDADLSEFAVPETAEVVSGRTNFMVVAVNSTPRGYSTLKKQLGSGSGKRKAAIKGNYGRTVEKQARGVNPAEPARKTSLSRLDYFTISFH